jgi:hypothetical protein
MLFKRWSTGDLVRAAVLFGVVGGGYAPAIAGSDKSSDTYAGDYSGGSLPIGTLVALQYLGFSHADAAIDSTGHELQNSHANVF